MSLLHVKNPAVERHFTAIDQIGNLGPGKGFLRAGYSTEETRAMEHFMELGRALGFRCGYDEVGNAFIEKPGTTNKWVEMFSHVDTVNMGGNFDGLVGVAAGFEALVALANRKMKVGIRLRIFRLEEGDTFKIPLFGSSAAFGMQSADVLGNVFQGMSLRDAMSSQGYKPQAVGLGKPTILPGVAEEIVAAYEIHISQAPDVPKAGKRIGLVSSIRGSQRYFIELEGKFAHSGAVERKKRSCTITTFGHIIVELEKLEARMRAQKKDILHTIGITNSDKAQNEASPRVYQTGVTKVPGYTYFSLDIRSNDDIAKAEFAKNALEIIKREAKKGRVKEIITPKSSQPGAKHLDAQLLKIASEQCAAMKIPFNFCASGASHDALRYALHKRTDKSFIPTMMIFIPGEISHEPAEYAEMDDIALSTSLLGNCILEVDRRLGTLF